MNLLEAKELAKKNALNRPDTKGRLGGKIAVVTGGAQGFGFGIAEELYREGASVVLADINEELAKAYGMTADDVKKYIDDDSVSKDICVRKAIELVKDAAVITEAAVEATDAAETVEG